jgi:hypothetical protein
MSCRLISSLGPRLSVLTTHITLKIPRSVQIASKCFAVLE